MKRNTIFILSTLVCLGFSSCADFLKDDLKGEYSSENFYTSEAQALRAINGVYNGISFSSSNNRLWVFGDVASDDSEKGGNAGDQGDITFIDDFTANADNGMINIYWQFLYESIARSNNVIANIEKTNNVSTALKTRIIGEAKFIRAYSYFNLVNIYGEVPLKLRPQLAPEQIHVPLSSVEVVYAQIEKDLEEASVALPVSYSNSADQGRVTQGAALGLLAKTLVFEKKYSEALTRIEQLESLAQYKLLKDYSDLYKLGAEDSTEVIFAIRHLSFQVPFVGNVLNQYFAPLAESGYYFNAPTQSYVDCFAEKTTTGEDDPRLDASIGRQGKPWLNGDLFDQSWSSTGYLIKKHNQPLAEVEAGQKGDGGLCYTVLRYADILLLKAECINEQSNTAQSILDAAIELNKIRSRAGLTSTTATTQSTLRDAIRLERRKELGFEFHRFFDVMRYGKDYAEKHLGDKFTWVSPRFYYPIPQAERDANQAID